MLILIMDIAIFFYPRSVKVISFIANKLLEFNPEEIEKKMPKFNYYNRLGKELI